jgi:teichuronic acid biosynthesis glycosyltransferase TuaC
MGSACIGFPAGHGHLARGHYAPPRMRVLVVTNLWPTPERPERGGFVRDQVEALRKIEGLEVEVFHIEAGGGPVPYWRANREMRRRRLRRRRFDVVHAHYGLSAWNALAVRRRAALVVTFHGTDLAHPIVGRMSRAVAHLIDLAAPVSASLARAGLPGVKHIAILPVGVNLERFEQRDRSEARARLGLQQAGRYLLFPADPQRPEKRHDRAAALAKAANAELLTYGGVAPEDVPDMINAANAVVVTSEREGFGLGTLEALACDVPVLATDVGIAPLALSGIAGTLAAPYDRDAWLEALEPHLTSAESRVEGRVRAALFDRNRMAERVFQAYRELMKGDG